MPRPKRSPEDRKTALGVGGRILQVREAARLSQEEAVSRLGKGTRRSITDYESGKVLIPTDLAFRFCREFDVNFDWLMTGAGPQKKSDLDSLKKEEVIDQVRRAIEDVAAELGQCREKDTFPELSDPRDLVIVALKLALNQFGWHHRGEIRFGGGPENVARFIKDLVLTLMELLGEGRQMKEDAAFMTEWAKLSRSE